MMSRRLLTVLWSLSILALAGCGEDPAPGPVAMDGPEHERWEIALVEWRIEKNEAFMDSDRSPLPEAMRDGFEGLDYYFPEPGLRYRVPLERAASTDTVVLDKQGGQPVPYVVAGALRFRHDGQDHALTAYRRVGGQAESLFVPFHDLTNGESTYPGGRYLDVELAEDGTVALDFNKAYSPYCAYDAEAWNCVMPPPENRLPIRVEAGEKTLADGAH